METSFFDSDYFIISTKLYDVDSEMPAWSYLAQIKVDGSDLALLVFLFPLFHATINIIMLPQ